MQTRDHFGKVANAMPEAVFIPVGATTSRGVEWLTKKSFMKKDRVFHGLPHQRKKTGENTAYFLGERNAPTYTRSRTPTRLTLPVTTSGRRWRR